MTATPTGAVTVDTSKVVGVDPDLVVRPLGWKGDVPTLRNFSVGAAAGAMGLVADELVWKKAGAGKSSGCRRRRRGPRALGGRHHGDDGVHGRPGDADGSRRDGDAWLCPGAERRRCRSCRGGTEGLCGARVRDVPYARDAAAQHAFRGADAPRPRPVLRRRARQARPGVRPQAALRLRHPQGGAAAEGRGARRRRRDHPALRRPQAACDGPAARRPCGHERLDRRGSRSR